jgi:hypothetical protein
MLGVRKFARSDMDGSTPYGTKQHTSLLEWKVKMLQILPIILSIISKTRPTICITLPSEEKNK